MATFLAGKALWGLMEKMVAMGPLRALLRRYGVVVRREGGWVTACPKVPH